MANISNKPDISQINRFTERLSKLKKFGFLQEHYREVLSVIKSIYSYIDHMEARNTELSIAYNQEKEKRQQMEVYIALMQFEMNRQGVRPYVPYLTENPIIKTFVKDPKFISNFQEAITYKNTSI